MTSYADVAISRSAQPTMFWLVLLLGTALGLATGLLMRQRKADRQTNKPLPPRGDGLWDWLLLGIPFFMDVNGYLGKRRGVYGATPFRFYVLGQPWTMCSKKEDMRSIMSAPETELSMLGGFDTMIGSLLPTEFTVIPRRHFFVPALRTEALSAFVQSWHHVLEHELDMHWGASGSIELFQTCKVLIMRLNLRVLMGPIIFQKGYHDIFFQSFLDIDPEKSLTDTLGSLWSPSKKEVAWSRVKAVVAELMHHYEEVEAANDGKGQEVGQDECVLHGLVRAAAAEGRKLGVAEATADLFAFVFAALTNTFAILAWCVLELMAHPTARERVLSELESKMDNAALASYDSLVVTKAFINEVIRLHTPGLFFRKVVNPSGVDLSSGHHVPEGDLLGFSVRQVNLSPDVYSEPEKFDLDRYLEPRNEHKKAGVLGFNWGSGKHPCLGVRFANIEIAMLLRALFKKYDLAPIDKAPTISRSQLATADKPTCPVYVTFTPRR